MNAVKNYNGKDFGGNKISVKKVENYVINLSQKRLRSPDRQALSLIPVSKVISLAGKRVNQEINLNGQVFLGSGKSGIAKKEEFKGKNEEIPEIKTQTIKQENLPIIEKKPEIQEIVFEKLKNIDFIRKSYWQWKKKTKKGNNLTRTIEDIKICNLVNRSECLNVMKDYYLSYYIR